MQMKLGSKVYFIIATVENLILITILIEFNSIFQFPFHIFR